MNFFKISTISTKFLIGKLEKQPSRQGISKILRKGDMHTRKDMNIPPHTYINTWTYHRKTHAHIHTNTQTYRTHVHTNTWICHTHRTKTHECTCTYTHIRLGGGWVFWGFIKTLSGLLSVILHLEFSTSSNLEHLFRTSVFFSYLKTWGFHTWNSPHFWPSPLCFADLVY